MPSKKKIFLVVPSPTGHLNPVVSLITELRKKHDIECIFYGNQENREQIEKSGSQFRLYANRNMCELVHDEKTQDGSNAILNVFHKFIDMSYELVPQLVRDARVEKPDIFIYEACFFPAHYLVEILKKENRLFKEIEFYPYFAVNKTIFTRLTNMKFNFHMVLSVITLFLRQFLFSWKFRIHIYNPLSIVMNKNNNPKLVSVFPELQPCREEFDKTYNFIGPCVSEQARSQSFKSDPELDTLLELFPSKGESTTPHPNGLKLIYMSLGTVFNNLPYIFEKTFEAIRDYDTKGYNLKSSQFRIIISLGETSYIKIKERVESGDLKIPENILIRPKVPQLEILKRADLFITHCGMNSTSEAIKYAVPMIAIPIEADQPMVARRVCDELSLGIRLNSLTITVDEISNAIDQMLSDEKYKKNIQKLSEVSSNYNGQVEGVKIISEYLN